ncbi:acetyl-CoA C-acetyltransferase [Gordonia neofelifaecis]|uniref:Acetyl-CoA acetyltransferase n=1 Tax=Gordonia neofelifaecis NRRL B-59395 TaxID=644548 RepID=F1YN92_9ACTN|nr:acetyl-CoA C-acetyltransferase [Gordonia neofelifaecis]EGD53803.1 acetyl-CoA acetyltransferase [Gordonia neofelifaecis NRRL B-59395]
MSPRELQDVYVLGGNRIPFARSNGAYLGETNQSMLTAALNGLVDRYDLHETRLGEVAGGAVVKLARDHSLTRESLLDTRLSRSTPTVDVQQQCATGGQSVVHIANKIACGQIESGVACGADTTSDPPIGFGPRLRNRLVRVNSARSLPDRLREAAQLPLSLDFDVPSPAERRTGLAPGAAQAVTGAAWGVDRGEQDRIALASHRNLAQAYDDGFFDDLITPFGGLTEDDNLRRGLTAERVAALSPCFGGPDGTMTAANSTTLTDGASSVLMGNAEWAQRRGLQPLARVVDAQSWAVDYADGDPKTQGVLMAPVYAVDELLRRNELALQDFDFYEIHEAFASQVVSTLAAWNDDEFCRTHLNRDQALGEIDPTKLNVRGGSLATGHPFGATGGRIVATVAKLLAGAPDSRALVSICAGSGMAVTMILESA